MPFHELCNYLSKDHLFMTMLFNSFLATYDIFAVFEQPKMHLPQLKMLV